jgi:hypothetical protein
MFSFSGTAFIHCLIWTGSEAVSRHSVVIFLVSWCSVSVKALALVHCLLCIVAIETRLGQVSVDSVALIHIRLIQLNFSLPARLSALHLHSPQEQLLLWCHCSACVCWQWSMSVIEHLCVLSQHIQVGWYGIWNGSLILKILIWFYLS